MLREWWENDENGCTDMRSLDLTCSVLPLMKRDGQIFITQPVPERKSSPRCCWWKPEPLSHWGPFRRNILPWWPSSSPCAPNLFNVDWDDWNSCELWVTKNSEPVKVSNVTALTDQRQTDMDWHGLTWTDMEWVDESCCQDEVYYDDRFWTAHHGGPNRQGGYGSHGLHGLYGLHGALKDESYRSWWLRWFELYFALNRICIWMWGWLGPHHRGSRLLRNRGVLAPASCRSSAAETLCNEEWSHQRLHQQPPPNSETGDPQSQAEGGACLVHIHCFECHWGFEGLDPAYVLMWLTLTWTHVGIVLQNLSIKEL